MSQFEARRTTNLLHRDRIVTALAVGNNTDADARAQQVTESGGVVGSQWSNLAVRTGAIVIFLA